MTRMLETWKTSQLCNGDLDDLSVDAVGQHSVIMVTQSEIAFALRSLEEPCVK